MKELREVANELAASKMLEYEEGSENDKKSTEESTEAISKGEKSE